MVIIDVKQTNGTNLFEPQKFIEYIVILVINRDTLNIK